MMKLTQIVSSLIPGVSYVPVPKGKNIEMKNADGTLITLHQDKIFGEEILFKCYEKKSNEFRGFIVKNIKYGFFGDICDDVKHAVESADQKCFEFFGIRRTQKQK